ncbi:hypothetical protein Scep_015117 [Stephania cephalantha]|uniref:Uncharacterized protein n=1 Tax=Stephania cephalantha TaxID=152367 RepID=A0AAP0J562_9MAGN
MLSKSNVHTFWRLRRGLRYSFVDQVETARKAQFEKFSRAGTAHFDPAQPIGLDFTVQGVNDENRYSVSKGAHRNLKRAERARIAVNKILALVDSLIAKTRSWEDERRKVFLYDELIRPRKAKRTCHKNSPTKIRVIATNVHIIKAEEILSQWRINHIRRPTVHSDPILSKLHCCVLHQPLHCMLASCK